MQRGVRGGILRAGRRCVRAPNSGAHSEFDSVGGAERGPEHRANGCAVAAAERRADSSFIC